MHDLAEYLSRRYPTIYSVVRKYRNEKNLSGWYGEGEIREITIIPLQKTYSLDSEDPMTVAALLSVQFLLDNGSPYFRDYEN